jgi:hypothetical protein
MPSTKKFVGLGDWQRRPQPLTTPQPGAGIGVRCDGGLVAIDYDDDDAALRASETLGDSPVNKAGRRGWTSFFRSSTPVPSEDFVDANGVLALQVLSVGRQTVLPPSVHPDSGQPYQWTNGKSLYDTPLDALPELPADYRDRLVALGYVPKKGSELARGDEAKDFEGPFAEINDLAMANMLLWIPELGLHNLRRAAGYQTWTAVATWRQSQHRLEDRHNNLKISKRGIVDFGDNQKGYSPLDLVIAAKGCELSVAFEWLSERVRPDTGPEVKWDGLCGVESKGAEAPPPNDQNGDPIPPTSLGKPWHFGDPVPHQPPMLVPRLIPMKGFGYIGGQWGTFKTFVTNDLAVAVASGTKFAGQQVALQGAVVQIELEGTRSPARLHAAAQVRGIKENHRLPIVHLACAEPPSIMEGKKPNPKWKKFSQELVAYAKAFAGSRGVPLALITIDPQNSIAGFIDEQSSAEGQIVANAWRRMFMDADCFVGITDHHGKDSDAGLRGTSAKETNPMVILSTGARKKDIYVNRTLEVRKMRNGQSGLEIGFRMKDQDIILQQEVIDDAGKCTVRTTSEKTLVIEWENELRPVGVQGGGDDGDSHTVTQRLALQTLAEMAAGPSGEPLPDECGGPLGLRGVKLDLWRLRLIDRTVIEGKNVRALFSRLKTTLLEQGQIQIGCGLVWIPLS